MTLVVSDTGPLNYLVLLGCEEVLPVLFSQVFVPAKVLEELQHEKTPAAVRRWSQNLPPWVVVKDVFSENEFPNLDAGESDALILALSLSARFVLLDDFAARLAAEKLGLTPVGTLGLLLRASDAGLLNFDEVFLKLQASSFRMSVELVEAIQTKRNSGSLPP